jgi:hypothetical protein
MDSSDNYDDNLSESQMSRSSKNKTGLFNYLLVVEDVIKSYE